MELTQEQLYELAERLLRMLPQSEGVHYTLLVHANGHGSLVTTIPRPADLAVALVCAVAGLDGAEEGLEAKLIRRDREGMDS